jgi:dienelactone hydrolase
MEKPSMKIIICLISLFVPAIVYGWRIEEPPGSQSVEEYIAEEKKRGPERHEGLDPLTFSSTLKGIEKSWEDAVVFLPGKTFSTSASKVNLDKKYPVVIYLHGCAGIVPSHDYGWAKEITKHGFIVVMPNSFAIPKRPSNCDAATATVGFFFLAYLIRNHEIAYAYQQLSKTTWADMNNIFLMGFSEGAVATARSEFKGFNGAIIMGWTCTSRDPQFNGIFIPKKTPVLALAYLDDRWHPPGSPWYGKCADQSQGRDNFTQLSFEGTEHQTLLAPGAIPAVDKFLLDNLKK